MLYSKTHNRSTQRPMEGFVKKEPSIMHCQGIGCVIMMRQQKLLVYYVEEQTAIMKI